MNPDIEITSNALPQADDQKRNKFAEEKRNTPRFRTGQSAPDPAGQSIRHRLHVILEAGRGSGPLGLIFEIFLVFLIVANALVVSLDSVERIAQTYRVPFQYFEIVSVIIFTIEYGARIWTAPEDPRYSARPIVDRLRYMSRPYMLIDLVAVAPALIALFVPFADLRILRLFRLLRLLKIARYSPAVTTLIHVLSLERRALFGTLVLLLCLTSLCGEGMYLIEGRAQPNVFGNLPSCMYWAIITLTTVGYGDTFPITAAGRVLAAATAILGLGLFALPVGIVASAFVTEIHRRDFVVTSSMMARIPLFAGLDVEAMSEIMAALRSHMVAPHVPIVVAGESASTIYFVVSGVAKAVGVRKKDGGPGTMTLGPGDVIASAAVLNGSVHELSIFAHTPMRLLALSGQDLATLLRKFPRLRRRIEKTASRSEKRKTKSREFRRQANSVEPPAPE